MLQIIRAVHSHQAEEEAGADLNSRGSDSPDAADGLTARSCSEPIADKPPGMAQRFSSAPEKGVGIGPKGPVESGGEEPAASVLKRTCQVTCSPHTPRGVVLGPARRVC
eukprot:3494262-Rhodomonas_salina.6